MMWMIILSLILVALVANILVTLRSRKALQESFWDAFNKAETEVTEGIASTKRLVGTLRYEAKENFLQHDVLYKIQNWIKQVAETEVKNQNKKGEANRTLRRRIQEYKELMASGNKQLAKAWDSRDKAVQMAELLHEELSETRKFLEAAGVPTNKLTKHLEEHFKGNIPGVIYAAAQNEIEMRKQISKPLVEEVVRQPDDAA